VRWLVTALVAPCRLAGCWHPRLQRRDYYRNE